MGSNALKATILDRGHAKEASRGVESHFAAQGTARQPRRQPGRHWPAPPVWPDSAFLPPLEPFSETLLGNLT